MLAAGALSGCTTSTVLLPHAVELVPPSPAIAEDELLDVAVEVFDPGVPAGEIDKETLEALLDEGIYVGIRRAESIYMATRLRDALQRSRHWGAVWVTPGVSTAADLDVTATILQSDGYLARLDVLAVDAAGTTWLDETYELEAPAAAYNLRRYPGLDPYQDLFNSIANDLAAARARLPAADARRIRTIASVRYAAALSPDRFGEYIIEKRRGARELVRLPATDDPIFVGTQQVRQRELLLLETLNAHYDSFAANVETSYASWRAAAREEAAAIHDLKRSARWHRALGIAATLASLASMSGGGGQQTFSGRFVRESLMLMGASMLQRSAMHDRGADLHRAVLEELSQSYDDEAAPLVVEIAGVEHRLTGTAQMQLEEWRKLLKEMYRGAENPVPAAVR